MNDHLTFYSTEINIDKKVDEVKSSRIEQLGHCECVVRFPFLFVLRPA